LDSVFGKTETSREISALLYLVQSEIRNYVKNESNIIRKGLRSINFIKAVTAYACLQIMTYDTILKKRKMTLLYEGNSYLEPVPNKLIESEENEFFSIMNNSNDVDKDDTSELSSEEVEHNNKRENQRNLEKKPLNFYYQHYLSQKETFVRRIHQWIQMMTKNHSWKKHYII